MVFPGNFLASQSHGQMSAQLKGAPPTHMKGTLSYTPPNAYGVQAGGPQSYSTITSLGVDRQTSVASDKEKR